MSLILDALNKADNERKQQQEQTPGIATSHDRISNYEMRGSKKGLWAGAAVGAVLLLLVSVYFLGRSSLPEERKQSKQRITQPSLPEERKQSKQRITQPPPPLTPASKARTELSPPAQNNANQQLIAEQYAKARANNDLSSADKHSSQVGQLYNKDVVVGGPATLTKPVEQAGLEDVSATSPSENDIYEGIGEVRDLSYGVQEKLPTLMYTNHQYNPSGDSSVTINGKKTRRGGSVAPGITVHDIISDGVILEFENQKFKMVAFSSWVNM